MSGRRFTLEDVRRSYTPEKRWAELQGELPAALLYRPVSFWLTPPLLSLGVPPLVVTALALAVAVAMPVVAWAGGEGAHWGVAALGLAFHVLDCVDGNMARTLGRTSVQGAVADAFVDASFWALLLASLGLLVARTGGGLFGPHALEVALAVPVLVLVGRQTRDVYAAASGRRAGLLVPTRPARLGAADVLRMAFFGLENVYVFAIALGGALGALDRVLLGIAAYATAIALGGVALSLRAAARET